MTHPVIKRQTTLLILKNNIRYSNSRHVRAVNAPNIEDDQPIVVAKRLIIFEVRPCCRRYVEAIGVFLIIFNVGGVNRPTCQLLEYLMLFFRIVSVVCRFESGCVIFTKSYFLIVFTYFKLIFNFG